MRATTLTLICAAAFCAWGCGRNEPAGADRPARAHAPAAGATANAGAADPGKLDAEIAQLEAEAEKRPDDKAARDAVADAYVRRGNARYDAGKLNEALDDFRSALSLNPAHEEAQLKLAQLQQEIGGEPKADDGRPVSVPAKPENSNK